MTITNFVSKVLVAHQMAPPTPAVVATSPSDLTISVGLKSLLTQSATAFRPGQRVRLISVADPTDYMEGDIVTYAGTAMSVQVTRIGPVSSGAASNWQIVVAGDPGAGDILSSLNGADFANPAQVLVNIGGLSSATALTKADNLAAVADKALARDNLSVVHSIVGSSGIVVTGGAGRDPVISNKRCVGPNLVPNCNAQLNSRVSGFSTTVPTAIKEDGSGYQDAILVTSFDAGNNQPRMFSTDTKQLHVGSLVHFGGPTHGGLTNYPGAGANQTWALRVVAITPNNQFSVQIPFSQISPASSQLVANPVGISQGPGGYGPDGWSKNIGWYWPDDFPSNRCPGAKRVFGFRKSSNAAEEMYVQVPEGDIGSYRGRNIVFGFRVYHKTQGGAGTSVAFINDGVTDSVSVAGTGATYNDPTHGKYELLTVSVRVSMTATQLRYGFRAMGSTNDVLYMGTPTLKYGDVMLHEDLQQNPREHIKCRSHWNPPFSVPFGPTLTPNIDLGGGAYGWKNLDIEALSFGQAHNSLSYVNCKIEFLSTNGNAAGGLLCFVCALDNDNDLVFGPQAAVYTSTATECTNMTLLPLVKGSDGQIGTFSIFFSQHDYNFQLTFDFDDVVA